MKSLSVTIQVKDADQYFALVLLGIQSWCRNLSKLYIGALRNLSDYF